LISLNRLSQLHGKKIKRARTALPGVWAATEDGALEVAHKNIVRQMAIITGKEADLFYFRRWRWRCSSR
jgi:hypothetical protein